MSIAKKIKKQVILGTAAVLLSGVAFSNPTVSQVLLHEDTTVQAAGYGAYSRVIWQTRTVYIKNYGWKVQKRQVRQVLEVYGNYWHNVSYGPWI